MFVFNWKPSDELRLKVADLVLIRQQPGTTSGIVFETIEDKTGVANLILPDAKIWDMPPQPRNKKAALSPVAHRARLGGSSQ